MNPFQVVKDFEAAVCEYTGSPYCVTTNSCTMALLLVCDAMMRWQGQYQSLNFEIPKRTYVGVPMAIKNAGGGVRFRDEDWCGWYQLRPFPVWDSARYFSSGMYRNGYHGNYICLSFHQSKILGDSQGGAILCASANAAAWFRKARFDGRTEGVAPKDDTFDVLGHHCYLSPDVASRLLWKLSRLPKRNEPLPNDDYPDLSQMEIFK